jgi:pyruvate formate lyase activating enzyme
LREQACLLGFYFFLDKVNLFFRLSEYMAIPIKGLEKLSVIDYPGKTCAVLFLAGCNFRCPYCQNPDLIRSPAKLPDIPEQEVLDLLRERRKWLDGICITGGEPCLHRGLPEFIRKARKEGFLVKLDTNGSNPGMLKELITEGLLDYVAMDIKAPPGRYGEVAKAEVDVEDVRKSAELIMKSGVGYEFRTTVIPGLIKEKDMRGIGEWLKGADRFYIQQFVAKITLDKAFEKEKAYSQDDLKRLAEVAGDYFKRVGVRA